MLKVLTCKPCSEFYGDGNFPCDIGDNCEIYCGWCGQGGALFCCSFCPRVFYKKCVRRNFGASFVRLIQKTSEWACFCCAQKPLWPHRAICRALIEDIEQKKTETKALLKDTTTCCDVSFLSRRRIKLSEKNGILATEKQWKINAHLKVASSSLEIEDKITAPLKSVSENEQSILKTNIKLRNEGRNGNSVVTIRSQSKGSGINFLTCGIRIFENLNLNNSNKNYLEFPPHQLFCRPVLHGETLINPPDSKRLILPEKSQNRGVKKTSTSKFL